MGPLPKRRQNMPKTRATAVDDSPKCTRASHIYSHYRNTRNGVRWVRAYLGTGPTWSATGWAAIDCAETFTTSVHIAFATGERLTAEWFALRRRALRAGASVHNAGP